MLLAVKLLLFFPEEEKRSTKPFEVILNETNKKKKWQ